MKSLYFINEGRFYPPSSGGDYFKLALFKYLSKYFDLEVLTTTRNFKEDTKCYATISDLEYKIKLYSPNKVYSDFKYFGDLIPDGSLIMFNTAELVNSIGLYLKKNIGAKLIYEAHNIDYILSQDINLHATVTLEIKSLESQVCDNADLIFVRSNKDKKDLEDITRLENFTKIKVGKSGIDDSQIKNIYHLNKTNKLSKKIGFLGHLNYFPNVDAVKKINEVIAPKVFEYDPEIQFIIAGQGMADYAKNKACKNVKFVGWVDDLDKFFADIDLCLCPLEYGSGTRIKLMDYLARGLPTISSHKGIEGLEPEISDVIFLEDDLEKYIEIIKDIYDGVISVINLNDISYRSINYVKKYRSWSEVVKNYYINIDKCC